MRKINLCDLDTEELQDLETIWSAVTVKAETLKAKTKLRTGTCQERMGLKDNKKIDLLEKVKQQTERLGRQIKYKGLRKCTHGLEEPIRCNWGDKLVL